MSLKLLRLKSLILNKLVLGILCVVLISGCTPNSIQVESVSKFKDFGVSYGDAYLAVDRHRFDIGVGDFFSGGENPYGGSLNAKDMVLWLNVHSDHLFTSKYYYVRSVFGQDVILPSAISPFTDLYFYFSFGGREILDDGEADLTGLEYQGVSSNQQKLFFQSTPASLHYHIAVEEVVEKRKSSLQWEVLPMLEITKAQYEILDKRCGWPWRNVRCFIDRDFPGLTPEQLEYVIAHEHEDDQDRLNGTVPMPEQPRSNPYK